MMSRRQSIILGMMVALLSIALGAIFYQLKGARSLSSAIPPEGLARLQSVSFADIDGEMQTLAQWRGKLLVVNFWATWCPPCRVEMPGFSNLQKKYEAKGVQFVGIGIDSPSAIKEYALQNPVSYPLLLGGSESMDLVRTLGNPNAALPYTLVLDAGGRPVFAKLGMVDELTLEKRLQALLATKAAK